MRLKGLTVGALGTNCWITADEETNQAIIFDPADNAKRIFDVIEQNSFKPEKIVLTHCHFDHFLAAEELKRLCGDIPVIIPEKDKILADNPTYNLSASFMGTPKTLDFDDTVDSGDTINCGSLKAKVIFTPGHTPGGCCYYFENEHVLISGDTLFFMSVGRSDFPLSDGAKLNESIRDKLFVLPDDTRVFTGHGQPTTIGFEKTNNMYVY
ncbi:MAG: MBL fold metallo-hydrolase [Firmicutes bacterium]|nr:MBL fold metallo-hydrolase [Bacillota bacterium]